MRREGVCANPACRRAGKLVPIRARGLCSTCHRNQHGKHRGPITLFPCGYAGRKWSPAEEKFLTVHRAEGWTYKAIAKALNRPVNNVRQKGFKLCLTTTLGKGHGRGGPGPERTAARLAFIREHGCYPDRQGHPGRPLPKWFFRENADPIDTKFTGRDGYDVWSAVELRTCREMLAAGRLPREIAARLGRTLESVRGMVKRIRSELRLEIA